MFYEESMPTEATTMKPKPRRCKSRHSESKFVDFNLSLPFSLSVQFSSH